MVQEILSGQQTYFQSFLGKGDLEGFWKPLEVARYRFLGEAERLKPPFSERKRAALERFSEASLRSC